MAFNKAKALQEAEKSVAQGRLSQAIKQYADIFEKDPSDLSLLNTIGDLYVRDKNPSEALKHFYRLADTYVQEGFTVKAIAIYKKIAKVDPKTAGPVLKLAELYQHQGLGREARDQYVQALEFFKKKNQSDKAIEVLRKIVQLGPENTPWRARLALFCEQAGRKDEAAQAYLEAAESALRRDDLAAGEPALKKALELDPKNPQIHLLRARVALLHNEPQQVEKIILSVPELKANPEAMQLLLKAYLATQKLEEAEKLVVEVYRADPSDFAPLASFSALCIERGEIDAAFTPLSAAAEPLIQQKNTGPLMECLREIWNRAPRHIPTLELIHQVCERTADEFTLPEVLEALGHAYMQAGQFAKGEEAFEKLTHREPENEHYRELLTQVQEKQGKKVVVARAEDFAQSPVALTPEPEAPATPEVEDAEQAALVKEALENSDLFARYNLTDKAVAELEKVLVVYPEQVEIHTRILEVCRKNLPARATQAAGALAQIFAKRGDVASAERYEVMASAGGGAADVEEAPPSPPSGEPEAFLAAPPTEAVPQEVDLTAAFPLAVTEEPAPPASVEVAFDLSAPPAPPAPISEAHEIDLSMELEALVSPVGESAPAVEAPLEPPAFNFEESQVEVDFYLDNGFVDEARKVVEDLERRFPGNELVAMLRERIEARVRGTAAPAPAEAVLPVAEPEPTPVPSMAPPGEPRAEEWELPTSYAAPPPAPVVEAPPTPVVEAPPAPVVEAPPTPVVEAPPVPAVEPPPAPPILVSPPAVLAPAETAEPAGVAAGGDLLGDLAGDLASSLEGLAESAAAPAPPATTPPPREAAASGSASLLSGLLEELGEPASEAAARQDDRETHYDLGVAFREMGLLDEAIGEFQKVVKGAGKGHFPPNFLQACSLLAHCFMEKKMPAIAAKWYLRALETPGLDEEAFLAVQYELGVAYEQAGDTRTALEKYTEVYSQNIDYRDVAEKIRVLQQKV